MGAARSEPLEQMCNVVPVWGCRQGGGRQGRPRVRAGFVFGRPAMVGRGHSQTGVVIRGAASCGVEAVADATDCQLWSGVGRKGQARSGRS